MKGISVKPDPFGTNSKIPSEAWQHEMHVEWKAEGGSVESLIKAVKDVFARCSKKIAVHVCTNHNHVFIPI
jgi:hypothetical protein